MTIQDLIDKLRDALRKWLRVPDLTDIYDALMHENGELIKSAAIVRKLNDQATACHDNHMTALEFINELQNAYATDPRRAEIAKEKAEAPTVIGGFTPRSKRIRNWEADRKAKPKE